MNDPSSRKPPFGPAEADEAELPAASEPPRGRGRRNPARDGQKRVVSAAERARRRAERQALRKERPNGQPGPRREPEDDDAALDDEDDAALARKEAPPDLTDLPLPETTSGAGAQRQRQSRARRLLVRLLVFVLLPTLAGAYYYYRQASPQFQSVSLLTIYSAETIPTTTTTGIDALIGLGAGSSVVTDGLSVREYVFSRDILRRLDEEEGFIAHFKDQGKDWLTRLPPDASFEDAFESYEDWVEVEVDPNSGVATLVVKAYSAEAAQRFSQAIIRYAEEMVNDLSRRARSDQVSYAEAEVTKAEDRLTVARQKLVEVQHERGEYNPELSAQAQLSIRTALESQVATAKAELAQLLAYMSPDAPQVIGAKEKVRALSQQVAGASRKMVAKEEDGQSLNKSAVEFEAVIVEKEFATAAYQAAMSSLSAARTSAGRQHRYLATIAPPSLADESTLPKRGLGVLTVFLSSLLFMAIGSLLVAGVKEHARL